MSIPRNCARPVSGRDTCVNPLLVVEIRLKCPLLSLSYRLSMPSPHCTRYSNNFLGSKHPVQWCMLQSSPVLAKPLQQDPTSSQIRVVSTGLHQIRIVPMALHLTTTPVALPYLPSYIAQSTFLPSCTICQCRQRETWPTSLFQGCMVTFCLTYLSWTREKPALLVLQLA